MALLKVLTLGIVLEGWCRASGDPELGRCRVGEHRGQRGGAGAGAGRGGVGWLRCCTTTALGLLQKGLCSPGLRQGLGAACPRCRSTCPAQAVPEGPRSWLEWAQPARSPALQLHRATRKTHPCCTPVGRAGSALVQLLPLPCPPSPHSSPRIPQPHRQGSVLTVPWGRAQAAGQRQRLCRDRQLKKEIWFN